ncbi:hypothetical protein E7X19_19670 [Bacteroides fragilis]|nr:hypothetical protein E7X03_19735 [Bacteroides fragilis]THC69555.1 hypothetical protein E7X19_19670 [Bacteroides fragilis]THC83753.1 hypothetical protein E7X23_18715 [Bacteroides fragilis]
MANPLSIRAQRFTKTLTRLYGLRIEKGFMYFSNNWALQRWRKISATATFLEKKSSQLVKAPLLVKEDIRIPPSTTVIKVSRSTEKYR